MKYERLTDKETAYILKNTEGFSWDSDNAEAQRYIRLAELEDKIENGTLIEAPCEDWDRKYFIVQERYTGKPTIVDTHHWEWYLCARLCGVYYQNIEDDTILFDYGKDMFDTHDEAEAKLKELQK